jgi:hypothetical protein
MPDAVGLDEEGLEADAPLGDRRQLVGSTGTGRIETRVPPGRRTSRERARARVSNETGSRTTSMSVTALVKSTVR